MTYDIKDLRSGDRYFVTERLTGSFGAVEATIINMAEQGAQVEHSQPLRLGTKARLWFKRGDVASSVQAISVWSRLSKTPNEYGKYLYRSGLRIEEGAEDWVSAMQALADANLLKRDSDSLERKRKRLEQRAEVKSGQPTMKFVPAEPDITAEQELLIQHARKRLGDNFDEAQKWYSRAYFALKQGRTPLAAEIMGYPEDVLAVWEYLERSIPLSTIAKVFAKNA
jgi:tetratricopeptide (TPR) repeat protein